MPGEGEANTDEGLEEGYKDYTELIELEELDALLIAQIFKQMIHRAIEHTKEHPNQTGKYECHVYWFLENHLLRCQFLLRFDLELYEIYHLANDPERTCKMRPKVQVLIMHHEHGLQAVLNSKLDAVSKRNELTRLVPDYLLLVLLPEFIYFIYGQDLWLYHWCFF